MPVNKECIICHKQFSVPPARDRTAKTCSKECMGKLKSISGKQRVTLECDNCHKEFRRFKSQLVGGRQFCSRTCANEGKTICIFECEVCHKVFHKSQKKGVKARFCSQKCRGIGLTGKPNWRCHNCGKDIHVTPYLLLDGANRYCSWDCKVNGETYKLGEQPKYSHYYGLRNWQKIRKEIIERDNYFCQKCGVKPKEISKLQVHHIKRRRLGGTDDPSNLVTLCFSCHKLMEWESVV